MESSFVIKLGGSLITDFLRFGHTDPVLKRKLVIESAMEIAAYDRPTVVIHGTGTFGKPPAVKYGYLNGHVGGGNERVVSEVSRDLAKLESEIFDCLFAGGLRPFRISASTIAQSTGGKFMLTNTEFVLRLLDRKMTPVIGGGFIFDDDGFNVCSSDYLAVEIATAINANKLIFATKARGVYKKFGYGDEIYELLNRNDLSAMEGVATSPEDVSGGMAMKIATAFKAADRKIPTFIIDGRMNGNISETLYNKPISGTRLVI